MKDGKSSDGILSVPISHINKYFIDLSHENQIYFSR